MVPVLEVYKQRRSDLWRHQPASVVEAVEQYHVSAATPLLRGFVKEQAFDRDTRQKALSVLESLTPDSSFLKEIFELYKLSTKKEERELAYTANALLISHGDAGAIRWRLGQIVERAAAFTPQRAVHIVDGIESEFQDKTFAKPLMELKRAGYEESYLQVLDQAMEIWQRGKTFEAYAGYLWEIVYSYFDNLKEGRSYVPLQSLERRIAGMKEKEGANWLAARMVRLRRSYLSYLGKPRNVSEAITKYNEARIHDNKHILNSSDLFRQLQDAMESDLRRWIEGEGAYDLILTSKVYKTKIQEYEKLIQKTLKTQIENILLKRGFQLDVFREPHLYDDKRTDFLVRYGFAGPIIIEVKLTSNKDIRGSKIEQSASYLSMERYMYGFGALHGIFLVIDNTAARNLDQIKKSFEQIPNVWVKSFGIYKNETGASKKKNAPSSRKTAKAVTAKRRD